MRDEGLIKIQSTKNVQAARPARVLGPTRASPLQSGEFQAPGLSHDTIRRRQWQSRASIAVSTIREVGQDASPSFMARSVNPSSIRLIPRWLSWANSGANSKPARPELRANTLRRGLSSGYFANVRIALVSIGVAGSAQKQTAQSSPTTVRYRLAADIDPSMRPSLISLA
jgi:hypothetical protein